MGKPLVRAVLDGAAQIAIPTFVSTLAICIVFVPVLLLTGTARYLFTPLAMAVVFAMLASYLLSRTLVPTMATSFSSTNLRCTGTTGGERRRAKESSGASTICSTACSRACATAMSACSIGRSRHRGRVLTAFMAFSSLRWAWSGWSAKISFPTVDSGQMRCMRAPPQARASKRPKRGSPLIEREIRDVIPANEMDTIIDNIGIPNSWASLAQGDIPTISSADGEILISLNKEKHASTATMKCCCGRRLHEKFPGHDLLLPAGQHHQPDFELRPARADRFAGGRAGRRRRITRSPKSWPKRSRCIPGAADVHVHQVVDQPEIRLNVDRVKAAQLGLTQARRHQQHADLSQRQRRGGAEFLGELGQRRELQRRRADAAIPGRFAGCVAAHAGLAGYERGEQRRRRRRGGAATRATRSWALRRTARRRPTEIPGAMAGSTQLLSNLVTVQRGYAPVIVNHYNVWPVFDVYANVDRARSGRRGRGSGKDHARGRAAICRAAPRCDLRGQIETMQSSFFRLGLGMIFAVVLVYLLMTVNFQSWLDPFIILTALPGAMAGILWMLFVTGTTLSVPSLMGAIMCIGVATANSILMVTFANDERAMVPSAREAMLSAGYARIRPVLMTATAMMLGMLPMALGLGEGGEQNAPLGRAVIGGLAVRHRDDFIRGSDHI